MLVPSCGVRMLSLWVLMPLTVGEQVATINAFSRRAGTAQQLIAVPVRIGDTPWLEYPNDRGVAVPARFSWSHGDPVQSVASTESGLFVASPNATPPSGFSVSIKLPSVAVVVRVFVGSAGSVGQLNATLVDSAGNQIDVASYLRPSGLSQTLIATLGAPATAAASLRVTWVQASDKHRGYNINFQAVAVQSPPNNSSTPCATALCTNVVSCSAEPPADSNCTIVDLDTLGNLDWLHAGDSSLWPNPHPQPPKPPPPPFPGPPQCQLPETLRRELNHPQGLQIPGPRTGQQSQWLASLRSWRASCRVALQLSSAVYEIDDLKWTQTAYYQPLTMPYDRFFYDERSGNYTIDRWLDSLEDTVGGIDAAVLWSGYTNLGADNRDQFELMRSLPGGTVGLRHAVDAMHARGVKALLPYNPWDQATQGGYPTNETMAAIADAHRMTALLKETNADGVFGDGNGGGNNVMSRFFQGGLHAAHPAALQSEGGGSPNSMMNYTTMGWGYWQYNLPNGPPVDLMKFLEPRWVTLVCDRWSRDKTSMTQLAFFNGVGVDTWQNVWGIWQGMTSHDGEALRRLAPILRFFGRRELGFLQSPGWIPHAPLLANGCEVYASEWPIGHDTLWTIVNQGKNDSTGPLLAVAANDTRDFYDCYHGIPVKPVAGVLSLTIEQSGYGCVFATANATLSSQAQALMSEMRGLTQRRLDSFPKTWTALQQTMRVIGPTSSYSQAPEGMVRIPGASSYEFIVSGQEIEPGFANPHALPQGPNDQGMEGVDVQFPWETVSGYKHNHTMTVPTFYIDRTPVTRAAYAAYLNASEYCPKDQTNFLKTWVKNGSTWTLDSADAEKPVTHVSLNEAREYCAFYHRRLPNSWEWQLAAQGLDGRLYPWGDNASSAVDGTRCPRYNMGTSGDDQAGLMNVTSFPSGASPYGVLDMVGNVWQYTNEFIDAHGRAAVLRGGSSYLPCCDPNTHDTCPSGATCLSTRWGGDWYFPNGPKMRQLNTHGHYHLMSDSYERAGTIGFRCAADAVQINE